VINTLQHVKVHVIYSLHCPVACVEECVA